MQAHKQIFTFSIFIIILIIFNFYKSVIKREKGLKQQREEAIRNKIELQLKNTEERMEEELIKEYNLRRQRELLDRMREHKDICYDIQALVERPIYTNDNHKKQNRDSGLEKDDEIKAVKTSGPIIYLFVIVLLCSLAKAATDLSKHLKNKSGNGDDGSRRCSLQEYANFKHERRASKAPFVRRSTVMTMSSRSSSLNKSFEERRIGPPIPEFNNGEGLITEPGTPTKTKINGLAGRPPPLLRRCSVPAFAQYQLGQGRLRRPSIDSFSEDDSSPDIKRRVRMIHRH